MTGDKSIKEALDRSVRIVLDRNDFQLLVQGGVVEKENAKIILSDIGFGEMRRIITEEVAEHGKK